MTQRIVSQEVLDSLVGEWLTLPDLAELLNAEVSAMRRLVAERSLIGVKRGKPLTFQVPRAFIVPEHRADPGNARAELPGDGFAVLSSLQGTLTVLADGGFSDSEAITWLFSQCDDLGEVPLDALIAGRKARVRAAAQALG